jgi:hypothetical protein
MQQRWSASLPEKSGGFPTVVALLVGTSSAAAHHPIRTNIYARPRKRRRRAESLRDSPSTTRFHAASVLAPLRDVADEPPAPTVACHVEQHAPPDDQVGSRFPSPTPSSCSRSHGAPMPATRGACVPTRNPAGGCLQVSATSDTRFRRPAVVCRRARLASTTGSCSQPHGWFARRPTQAPAASFRSQHYAYAEITTRPLARSTD